MFRSRSDSVVLRNHDRSAPLDLRLLRRIVRTLLLDILDRPQFDLEIHIVDVDKITRLNENYLRHQGVTDVIAFDYSNSPDAALHGEIYVCLPEARAQARRFRTTWQSELVRYLVHAVLHLIGYDDRAPAKRRSMKRAEDDALRQLQILYSLNKISGPSGREATRV